MSNIDTAKEREKLVALEGHTPGPWNPLFGEAYRVWADGMNIATAQFVTLLDRIPTKEVASNTCLIAAAPDLKATLVDALDAIDARDAEIERLRKAVEYDADAAKGMTAEVDLGDGAGATIIDPRSFADGGPEWVMRYGNPNAIRFVVASLLESYDWLLSDHIPTHEAVRQLRLMRNARAALNGEGK